MSATTITRLKGVWEEEFQEWTKRSLEGSSTCTSGPMAFMPKSAWKTRRIRSNACWWSMGATTDGHKELITVQDGYRESEQSWSELLLDLKQRGLTIAPKLAVGDGALGFWAALRKIFPETKEQRCWVHKTANVLNNLPKSVQPKAKDDLHEIWQAETRAKANQAFDHFLEKYAAKYDKACDCLKKDRAELLTFYDFPAEHWGHLRTTNPIESTFATIRLRHRRTKGNGTRTACLAMVFKLCESASRTWRVLNGAKLLPDVIQGIKFIDGFGNPRSRRLISRLHNLLTISHTRPNVSCEAIPPSSERNVRSQASRSLPNRSMSAQVSAPARVPHSATTTNSNKSCTRVRSMRGSVKSSNGVKTATSRLDMEKPSVSDVAPKESIKARCLFQAARNSEPGLPSAGNAKEGSRARCEPIR